MAYQTNQQTNQVGWDSDKLREQIDRLINGDGPRYRRLWAYYRNQMRACGVSSVDQGSDRPYRQAMEWGLPSRITGMRAGTEMFTVTQVDGVARKEVVIENDIGWRIDSIVNVIRILETRDQPRETRQKPQKAKRRKPKPYPIKPIPRSRGCANPAVGVAYRVHLG